MWQFVLGGLMAAGSLSASKKQNENAYRQQLQINGDLKTAYGNLQNSMQATNEAAGMALTKLEQKELRETATAVAKTSTRNVAGLSAMYAYANFGQQKAFTQGTIVAKTREQQRDYGKQAEAKFAQARSGWNQAEAQKKGAFEILLDAAIAGASGYATGKAV